MVWTVRIFNDQDRLTHTDTQHPDKIAAYGMLWTDPLPLPTDAPAHPTAAEWPFGFCIFNDEGVCEHATPAMYVGTEL